MFLNTKMIVQSDIFTVLVITVQYRCTKLVITVQYMCTKLVITVKYRLFRTG